MEPEPDEGLNDVLICFEDPDNVFDEFQKFTKSYFPLSLVRWSTPAGVTTEVKSLPLRWLPSSQRAGDYQLLRSDAS